MMCMTTMESMMLKAFMTRLANTIFAPLSPDVVFFFHCYGLLMELFRLCDVQHFFHNHDTVMLEETTGHLPAGDGSDDAGGDKVLSLL